ncbi:MAG: 4Fe-4S binding protein [Actinomycetia bacterium]|nr:4Fe-4S binding protein [Actinomycetes bacterium]
MKKITMDPSACLSCHSCELACVVAHSSSKQLFEVINERFQPRSRVHLRSSELSNFPLMCQQCAVPTCVQVCKQRALYVDPVSGIVLYDETRCNGCSKCVKACSYGAIEKNRAANNHLIINKCDLCENEPGDPACMTACPTGAISYQAI